MHRSSSVRLPKRTFLKDLRRYKFLFALLAPGILYYLVFHYLPMFGVVIAFQEYRISRGFLGSEWVGFKQFTKFLTNASVWQYIKNTLLINVYGFLWGFPVPILFAVMLSEVRSARYRKVVQTVSFLPHFISVVITVNIINMLFHVNEGLVNRVIVDVFGGTAIDFLLSPDYYRSLYIGSGIWSSFGWSSIIYLAAIMGIDPQLHESAMIDGAGTLRRIWHITLPGIRATVAILMILEVGNFMSSGFEKAYLMQKPTNLQVSEVISTYVYKRGILASGGGYPQYSYTTAIGISQSLVNVALLVGANALSRRLMDSSLF